jgi:hypothetical protein
MEGRLGVHSEIDPIRSEATASGAPVANYRAHAGSISQNHGM